MNDNLLPNDGGKTLNRSYLEQNRTQPPQLAVDARKLGMFGMRLILMSLTMLFIASLACYTLWRVFGSAIDQQLDVTVNLPVGLWFSSLIILGSSATLILAVRWIERGAVKRFRWAMAATLVLSLCFLIVQMPSLFYLLHQHYANIDQQVSIFGLIFVLIILHGLHVLAGLVPLLSVCFKAWNHGYTAKDHNAVRYVALYWHFLDVVWIVMFVVLLIVP